ncbi:MAG: sporulation protein YqfD [Clostridium sp.]|nr:sporulation protein YqfD [Clostridium sp.]
MIAIFRYLRGYLRIKVWGFSAERFMNLCGNRDILLWEIKRDGDVYYMNIGLRSFYKLRPIVKKTGTRVVILQRYGLPFFIPNLWKRKIFVLGLVLAVGFWFWTSFYIWDIEIEGNYQITEDVFSDFLEAEGVHVGMRISHLDIGTLEKEIRRTFTQVTWTSAKLSGTRLQIQLKENDAPIVPSIEKKEGGSDLVADCGGVIVSIIVRNGVPKVAAGDTVEAGAILVEGSVPVYNDDATVREYQYVHSDADIVMERTEDFYAELPYIHIEKAYTGRTKSRHFLHFGERELKIPTERPYLVYDSVMKKSRPFLFDMFSVPVYFGSYTYREYQNVEFVYSSQEAETLLNEKLMTFIATLEEKGVQIIEKDVKIDTSGSMWTISGSLLIHEQTGKSVDISQNAQDMGEMQRNE